MKHLFLMFGALAAMALLGLNQGGGLANAANPGTTIKPLLGCPDVSGDGIVLSADITHVVLNYGHDSTETAYQFLDDLSADGIILSGDITIVVLNYGLECPLVDTQVAQATLWAIANAPKTEDVPALAAIGYIRAGPDAPGQGVHYVNFANWADNTFDLAKPEGLVYQQGKLAAQLYVVPGEVYGWVGEDATTNAGPCNDGIDNDGDGFIDGADSHCIIPADPAGSPPDDVDIDLFCHPSPCSWDGTEGWHLHYHLCMYHIGMPNANLTAAGSEAACQTANNGGCLPSPDSCGTYNYWPRVGWMGHLWNWLPNANIVPDEGGTMNGRFADCFPDVGDPPSNTTGWKAYNCPQ